VANRDEEVELSSAIFKPQTGTAGIPGIVDDELSQPIDLSDLIEEVERGEGGEHAPPSLEDRPSLLWGLNSGLHSSLLSTAVPAGTAEGWQNIAEEFAAESAHVDDPHLKAALMCEAGRILSERLGRQEEGLLLMRNSESSVAEMLLSLRDDRIDSLASVLGDLERQARDDSLDPETRAGAWVEFGLACEDNVNNRQRALEAYQEALALVPEHPVALGLASDVAMVQGDYELASKLLQRRLAVTKHPVQRVALLVELGDVETTPEAKRKWLEQAHAEGPEEETALRRLVRLVSTHDEPRLLGALYRELARVSEDKLSRSTALHLAFLTLLEANEPVDDLVNELASSGGEDASPHELADTLAPLSEVALYLEQRIAVGQSEKLPENLPLLERIVDSLDAPREQALVREQIARIRFDRLRQLQIEAPPPADSSTGLPKLTDDRLALVQSLERDLRFCLVHLPEHRWVRSALAELLQLRGDVPGLVLHLQEWSRMQAAGRGRAQILLRLGRVHEEMRRDPPRAAEVYEQAVAEDPDNPDCLRALGRVYEKMRRWQNAIAALQRQARESEDGPERLAALRRVAEMAELEIGDVDLAIATLEEIANLDQEDILSLFKLAALARTHGRLPVLVNTLQLLVERLGDDVSRTTILVELGEVQELQLKQRQSAREAYERALRLSPGYTPALQSLARLYRDNGEYDALLHLHDADVDPVTDPALLALKAARVCLDEMGDAERAIEHLWLAYRTDPDLSPARDLLLQLLTTTDRIEDAYDLLRAQDPPQSAALSADFHYRLGLLAEALGRKEDGDASVARQDGALQHYRAALVVQPDHGLAWERSRRLLVAHNDTRNLVLLFEQLARHVDGDARAALLVQLGRLRANLVDGIADARRAYEEAAQLVPTDALVRREYAGLLRRIEDAESLPTVALVDARAAEDTHYRATMFVEAAELLLASGKPEDRELAATAILDALRSDPGNPYAVRHLERLLSEPDPPLAVTDAVSARAVRAQSDAERAIFYLESAELLERGGANEQARRAYQAAAQAMPGLVPADLGVKRTSVARSGPPPIRRPVSSRPQQDSLHSLMAEARDAAVRSGASGDAAEAKRALELLTRILERDADHRDALALTRAMVGQLADPAPAIKLLQSVMPRVSDNQLRYELGLLLGENTAKIEEAARYLQAAVEALPQGKQALRALVHCYRQMGKDAEAADTTERLLELYEPGEPSAIELRMGIARFLGRSTETIERALDHARIVLQARPDEPRALSLMADLLERSARRVDAAKLLARMVGRERDRAKQHELYLRQARLLATSGEHQDEALVAVEKAAQLNPGHRETVRLLTTLLQQRGQLDRLGKYLPPMRAAITANVTRGAVSIRDLRLLSQVAQQSDPRLAQNAGIACYALDPTSTPPPGEHLRAIDGDGLARLLESENLLRVFAPGEESLLHELLETVDVVMPRLSSDFPVVDEDDATPVPPNVDVTAFTALLGQWSQVAGIATPNLAASNTHNAAALHGGRTPSLRLGSNLWMQGETAAWRGLCAVAIARHALGGSLSRALNPMELDLLVAACFEVVGVFNAITADPDPRRLKDLSGQLGRLLPRRNRRAIERLCTALSSVDLVPSQTARATLGSDLRLAVLLTADFAGCLSAGCLLDGVAGGSLKQRVARSSLAQQLLAFVLSDEYAELRELAGR